jgi:chaperonin GroES
MTQFKPLHDTVLIKVDPASKLSAGGIVLPGAKDESSKNGTVLAVGKGRFSDSTGVFIATTVMPGDKVIFSSRSGTPIKLQEFGDDNDLVVMREAEVIGVFGSEQQ